MGHWRIRPWFVFVLVVLIGLVAAPAVAQTADGQTPAEETVCDDAGLTGASWGLCNAYCEAMDCDDDFPLASEVACARVLEQFQRASGGLVPPCFPFPPPECRSLGVVDFRGTNPCPGGNGDRVVAGTGVASSFFVLDNPTPDPIVVTAIVISDPQFSVPISLPITVSPGDSLPIAARFEPTEIGVITASLQIEEDGVPIACLELIGDGFPNDPPLAGACDINPDAAVLGQLVTVTLEASDSATLSNIVSCTAFGSRIAPSPPSFVRFNLVDDGTTPGDIPCDGIYTRTQQTGGLFGRGTWEFTFECRDKQGNLATGATFGVPGTGPTCTMLVE